VVPTYEPLPRFDQDWERLTHEQRQEFMKAVRDFKDDLSEGRQPRPGLRVKGVQGTRGVFELSWAQDGRATWEYGEERLEGEAHIVWRRIGTHVIFKSP
jgi:hypothetical protein